MFMPRSLSNTTVSPISMRPLVGVSKPAIIRNVVVLPQPEGPSSVTKEASSMERFRFSTA